MPVKDKQSGFVTPDYLQLHQELKRKWITLQLLWATHVAVHEEQAYRYSQFCHHCRQWRGRQWRSMRQLRRAGEKLFIDYYGPTVDLHMSDIISGRQTLADYKGLAACGGLSYGYVLGTGEGWAKSILFNSRVRDGFSAFFECDDSFALGVCNGC